MVRRSEAEFLLKRAKAFLDNAERLYSEGVYDLAAFNLEQAVQLLLKYKLLLIAGSYPKTHSLRRLFRTLIEVAGDRDLENFYLENINVIGDLESAYISARYLPVEYEEREVENMLILAKKIFEKLEGLGKHG
jgi:HEPN domain-containing protein